MANANLFQAFASPAARTPTKPFLLSDRELVTYGDMLELSGRAAAVLREYGVGAGDRVVSQVEKSSSAVFLYLGCLRMGAIFIPLNTAYTRTEIDYFLRDAEPTLFVCPATTEKALRQTPGLLLPGAVLTLEADGSGTFTNEMHQHNPETSIVDRQPDDTAAILYTSGTTGRSKGAMITHANLHTNVVSLNEIWAWANDDVLLHSLPIYHAHGLFVGLHCAMLNANTIIWHDRFEADRVIDDLPRASVFMGVPTFYTRLLASPRFDVEVVSGMRLFISGSAPLLEPVFEAFEVRTGQRILERYGMTEALMITSNPYVGERKAGSVGYPLPGVRVRVADEDGQPLPAKAPGSLEIKGPNVFKGYWRNPEKTAAEFRRDGWFVTGDIADIADDGRVSLIGRAKDLVITGGFNVYPKEVELLIDLMPGITESAVIGVPHPDFGEAVVAVVAAKDRSELEAPTMISSLRGQLAAFKVPKRIFVVDELPRNAMGKVQKSLLREQYKSTFAEG